MNNNLFEKEKQIMSLFSNDKIICIKPISNGYINATRAVTLEKPDGTQYRLVLQKINNYVFTDVPGLMNNICSVTEHLKGHLEPSEDPERCVMTVVPSLNGNSYEEYNGEFYRCYLMVENTISYDCIEKTEDFYKCGLAFGDFHRRLGDFPADTLCETIINFHNTQTRFMDLERSIEEDRAGRKAEVTKEIEFCLAHRALADEIVTKLARRTIPLRVVHNDTKLNNVLFDIQTGSPLCIVDLDTVMPGAACYDFGDAIRFGGTRSAEDEPDLSKVSLDFDLFKAFAKGYLENAKSFLTKAEIDTLATGALVITYENSLRFLKDYLDGDVYFSTDYPTQNLNRCRTQIKLLSDMETKLDEMKRIVEQFAE